MKKGRCIAITLFVAAFALGGWLLLLLQAPASGPTLANFQRLRVEMTEKEVFEILGEPRGQTRFKGGGTAVWAVDDNMNNVIFLEFSHSSFEGQQSPVVYRGMFRTEGGNLVLLTDGEDDFLPRMRRLITRTLTSK